MQKQTKYLIGITIFVILVLFLHFVKLLAPVEDEFKVLFSPVSELFISLGNQRMQSREAKTDLNSCQETLVDYKQRLTNISVDYVRLKTLEAENVVLKKTLNYVRKNAYDAVMAQIIGREVKNNKALLLIDKGLRDGLEKGMAAIVENGVYVGKIVKISQKTSVIILSTDINSRVAMSLSGKSSLEGIVEGKGNGIAVATLIPKDIDINTNTLIVTSGTEDKVPANLIIGIVNRVIDKDSSPFKKAILEPVFSLNNIDSVEILRSQVLRPE